MNKKVCVASIINEYRLVLNIGENDDVKTGDRFIVYSISNQEIMDPITNKSLGKLEIMKGKGKVIYVQENMCTIESCSLKEKTKLTRKNNPYSSSFFLDIGKTEEETIETILPFENPQIGDFAKEI